MMLQPAEQVGSIGIRPPQVGVLQRPLWILSGQVGVIIAVVEGFGARGESKPQIVALLLFCCLIGLIGFGAPGNVKRIILTAPVVAVTAWWLISYLWTFNVFGWWTDTQVVMTYVIAFVALVGLLPSRDLRGALVAACYFIIAYTVLQLLIHPAVATVNPDGVPGWRGGFWHKNTMGPFMVFAVLVLASFARPAARRTAAMLTACGLIVMSQSSTALGAGAVTLAIFVFVRRVAMSPRSARASLLVGGLCVAVVTGVLWSTIFSSLLGLRGKDSTLTGRTDVWTGVIHAIEQRPWQGYGAGGVWRNPAVEPARSIMRDLGFTVFHAHNGFLEMLLILGVVGLGLLVWLMTSAVRLGVANLHEDMPMAVFVISYVVLVVVLSITEVALFGVWLGLLCGAQCLMVRIDSQRRLAPESALALPQSGRVR